MTGECKVESPALERTLEVIQRLADLREAEVREAIQRAVERFRERCAEAVGRSGGLTAPDALAERIRRLPLTQEDSP